MVETWKKPLDKKENAGAMLTDLSKAFDSLNHELLIAKLNAYNFDDSVLKLLLNYFDNRKQCVKINNEFSSWRRKLNQECHRDLYWDHFYLIYT